MFAWSSNLIVAAVAVVLAVSVSVVDAQGKPTSLSIVHVNDHHSHFDTTSLNVYAPLIPQLSVNTSHIRLYYGKSTNAGCGWFYVSTAIEKTVHLMKQTLLLF